MASAPSSNQIEEILRTLGFEMIRRKGGARPGFTAICKFHQERTPSFSIGDNGLWMCWTCGVKGNLKQLHAKLGVEHVDDWRFSLKMVAAELDSRRKRQDTKKVSVNLPRDFVAYPSEDKVPEAIAKRLTWHTIKSFGLGYCTAEGHNKNRCIIPIHYRGKCVGYHGRALDNDMEPRYYNPPGFELKDYVFNYDGCAKGEELIVLEGAFNAMSMVEKGFKNTVATFGTQFKSQQITRIMSLGPTSIVLCFDRDASKIKNGKEEGYAGQKAAMRLASILSDIVEVSIMPLPFGQDPNDLPIGRLRECYAGRVPFERFKR